MYQFLSIAASRAVDDYAIKSCGIPGKILMENAGEALIHQMEIHQVLKGSPEILVLTGKGNNGGDGYVVATGLIQRGFSVSHLSMIDKSDIRGDAGYHYQRYAKLNQDFTVWNNSEEQRKQILDADIIIDALLGTGISGDMRAPYAEIIQVCNLSRAFIVAVDVPSGISGDLGEILDPCIKAEMTVSMGFGKQGCLFEPAKTQCGTVIPVKIGFPENSLEHINAQVLEQIQAEDFKPSAFTRASYTHKYTAGKVYVIAGSRGFTGAALLASTAALRSGAGLVKLALPESLGQIGESISLETIIEYLPETTTGGFSPEAASVLKQGCEWADTVALGPGIGRDPATIELVRELIGTINKPLVIDADALFALQDNLHLLKTRNMPTVLTPHRGEFKRLTGDDQLIGPAWKLAQEFAIKHGVHLLLKGAPSLLLSPDGTVIVNSTGYPGMATAGSGDVLTGVIAALWAQWTESPGILSFAMYIHGKAAELNHSDKGVLGLIAGDIIESLPVALKDYGELPT